MSIPPPHDPRGQFRGHMTSAILADATDSDQRLSRFHDGEDWPASGRWGWNYRGLIKAHHNSRAHQGVAPYAVNITNIANRAARSVPKLRVHMIIKYPIPYRFILASLQNYSERPQPPINLDNHPGVL